MREKITKPLLLGEKKLLPVAQNPKNKEKTQIDVPILPPYIFINEKICKWYTGERILPRNLRYSRDMMPPPPSPNEYCKIEEREAYREPQNKKSKKQNRIQNRTRVQINPRKCSCGLWRFPSPSRIMKMRRELHRETRYMSLYSPPDIVYEEKICK